MATGSWSQVEPLSEGIDLSKVTDLVPYDAPRAYVAAKQLLARFDRFGRDTQLNVHVLAATNTADEPIPESSGRFTNVFGFGAGEGTRE